MAWVFGYGSLMWRPDFAFSEEVVCFLDGYARRFYQSSTDHRGTEAFPGRVVTLIAEPASRCYGKAFLLCGDVDATLAALDYREKNGYDRHVDLPVCRAFDGAPLEGCVVYVARDDNEHYVGAASLAQMAHTIRNAVGPSGRNDEYLFRLADTLRSMGVHDEHVFSLEAAVKNPAAAAAAAADDDDDDDDLGR